MKPLWILSGVCLYSLVLGAFARQAQSPIPGPEFVPDLPRPLRVGIVGAGPAGSSAAFHLHRFSTELTPVEITIFDPAARAGGRSTTVNALDDPRLPTELGASIFVEINHIVYDAAKEFELITSVPYEKGKVSDYSLGVWDGSHFVFKQYARSGESKWTGWWDIAKLLLRYGLAPIRTQTLSKGTTKRFLEFYNEQYFPFENLTEIAEKLDLLSYTAVTGEETLAEAGINELFSREIIQASTRVNYGQNLASIHGLEALVCMATEGAMSVSGGNWQIFESMVQASKADLRYNTTVTNVIKLDNSSYAIRATKANAGHLPDERPQASVEIHGGVFDAVILTAPLQFSNISFHPPLTHIPEEIPYVTLHVTLLTSPHRYSPSFFSLTSPNDVPEMILTTFPKGMDSHSPPGVAAVGPAGFWSVNFLRVINRPDKPTQYLYKIFSPQPLKGTWVANLLDFPYENTTANDPLHHVSKEHISWLYEKKWHSYPYELPRSTFEEIRLDRGPTGEHGSGGKGVWYTSPIESFISTMETSALMGKNIAQLIINELWMENAAM